MKYLNFVVLALMFFSVGVRADAGIKVREKAQREKFELLKQFEVTMPEYGYSEYEKVYHSGIDKVSGARFLESRYVLKELMNPQNTVLAGQKFVARQYSVNGKVSREDFLEFLDTQSVDLLGLQYISLRGKRLKFDAYFKKLSKMVPVWKNSKADPGIPLSGLTTIEYDIWTLTAVFDVDFSKVGTFLVLQKE